MARTIFITGGAGWLGQALVKHLLACPEVQDNRLVVLVRNEQDARVFPADERLRTVVGNVVDRGHTQRFSADAAPGDILFHLAGIIHPSRIREFFQVNTEGVRHVIESFSGRQLSKAVFVSSNSPCGTNPTSDHLFDELAPYRPYMGYGYSKMAAEQLVRTTDSVALPWTIIRAPWFYGPHQPARQTQFFRMIRQGKMPIFGSGANRRSMAYVGNLASGLTLAAFSARSTAEIFWIADRYPYTMSEIISTVAEVLQSDFGMQITNPPRQFPSLLCEMAWCADWLIQSTGFYNQKIHVLSEMNKTIACSIVKAQSVLGYEPKIELREGMRRSVAWCLEQGYNI